MAATDTHRAIEAIWKMEGARLIAVLTRVTRDVSMAEDLAQEALASAIEQWPGAGIPEKPGAWLTTAAKNRAIDYFRRRRRAEEKHEELGRELGTKELAVPDLVSMIDNPIGDDLLRLM